MEYLRSSFLAWAQKQNPRDTKKIKHAEDIYNNIIGISTFSRPLYVLVRGTRVCFLLSKIYVCSSGLFTRVSPNSRPNSYQMVNMRPDDFSTSRVF